MRQWPAGRDGAEGFGAGSCRHRRREGAKRRAEAKARALQAGVDAEDTLHA
jgi:hypothetical protein